MAFHKPRRKVSTPATRAVRESQLPATQSQGPLLPAKFTNNNGKEDLGTAGQAISAGVGGAATTAAIGSSLAGWSPALAGLLAHPATAPIALLLGAALAASPFIYNKIKQGNIGNKIQDANNEIRRIEAKDPYSAAGKERIRQLQNQIQGYSGQPNAQGPRGQAAPEHEFWAGRKAYNEQVPLYTPQTEAYREGVVKELQENPAKFGPVRENAIQDLHQNILPNIAEQYFGRHADSSFSSAYPEALGRGASAFRRNLASDEQRFNAEREARLQNVALQPSFTTVKNPREPGYGELLGAGLLNKAGESALDLGGEWLKNRFSGKPEGAPQEAPQTAQLYRPAAPTSVNPDVYRAQQVLSNLPQNIQGTVGQTALDKLYNRQAQAANRNLGGGTR